MELIHWGNTTQNDDWIVSETTGPGYVRVYQVTSGRVFYRDNQESVELVENDIYILPSHSPFEVIHDKTVKFSCTWMHLNVYPVLVKKLVHISLQTNQHFEKLFELVRMYMDKELKSQYALQKCAEIFTYSCHRQGFLKKINSSFQIVLNSMEEKACGDVSIPELANIYGYTPEHFIRIFKKEVGITPYQFIIGYRMTKACELLRAKHRIIEISEIVGYHDVKTFECAFKKYHGRTASDYQKKYKYFI
ncbi:MAG: AraC family transcriptional regulator [Lachnospiraceae bacterium]